MKIAKWIGLALGLLVFEGTLATIVGVLGGFLLGAILDELIGGRGTDTPAEGAGRDFASNLMLLAGPVVRADNNVEPAEMAHIAFFLTDHFGPERSAALISLFEKTKTDRRALWWRCITLRWRMPRTERLLLLHFLFGIAHADYQIEKEELELLSQIAVWLGLGAAEYHSIKAIRLRETDGFLKVLQVRPSHSDQQVRQAHARLMRQYDPERFARWGEGAQKMAREMREKIQEAFSMTCSERGMRAKP